jgi:hypothetical protein
MSTKTLREQLIGAWKLVSYKENPVDGSGGKLVNSNLTWKRASEESSQAKNVILA